MSDAEFLIELLSDRTIAEGATPGPWQLRPGGRMKRLVRMKDDPRLDVFAGRLEDLTFIAHFNPAKIIEMLDERDDLELSRHEAEQARFTAEQNLRYAEAERDALKDVVEAAGNLIWEPGNVLVEQQAYALSRALDALDNPPDTHLMTDEDEGMMEC